MLESQNLVTALLILLCLLASIDLWRQYAIRDSNYWFAKYSKAAQTKESFWTLGYRLEDLEMKMDEQNNKLGILRKRLDSMIMNFRVDPLKDHGFRHNRESIIALRTFIRNDSAVVHIHCGQEGSLLRVGINSFRTDPRDVCQVFSDGTSTTGSSGGSRSSAGIPSNTVAGPQSMFEFVPLSEGAFGLKSIGSGYFIKAVPPPQDNKAAPWKLVAGGPVPGAAERFRLSDDGYLFSSLMGGLFSCGNTGEMIKGFSGTYSTGTKFVFEKVGEDSIRKARELVSLSNQIIEIQSKYTDAHQSSKGEQKRAVDSVIGLENPTSVKICLAIPMTSKGTKMSSVLDSPFWTNFFDSFMKSIDWKSTRYVFRVYLGFDKADGQYDTGDSWSEIRAEFKSRAQFRMTELMMKDDEIEEVLKKRLSLKLSHFEHLEGAPSQIVSQLVLQAYVDNFDYFYQVNDDTVIETPNWPPLLISQLASNPSIPNFGVTGPTDTNNDKIFTHSFVHRTHIEVFGHLFPPSFKNWWSDDWISTVYGAEHTFLCQDVKIKHNVGAQKLHGSTRYEVDQGARLRLEEELRLGLVKVDEWLKKNTLPRLPLPNVCGYVPLVDRLAPALRRKPTSAVESSSSSSSGKEDGDGEQSSEQRRKTKKRRRKNKRKTISSSSLN